MLILEHILEGVMPQVLDSRLEGKEIIFKSDGHAYLDGEEIAECLYETLNRYSEQFRAAREEQTSDEIVIPMIKKIAKVCPDGASVSIYGRQFSFSGNICTEVVEVL